MAHLAVTIDEEMLNVLMEEKGVSGMSAIKALQATNNESVEAAMAWLSEHANDADLDKLTGNMLAGGSGATASTTPSGPPPTDNPPHVKESLNQEWLKELLDMGFANIPAEKALYLTQNASLEAAVNWLSDHQADMDFDTPIIEQQQPQPSRPKLSPEEAQKKAYELQKRLREEREKREKQEAIDKERARIEGSKALQEAQRKLDEQQRKRDLDEIKREKDEHEKEKKRQKELLKREWEERFGRPYPEGEEVDEKQKEDEVSKKSKKDQIIYWVNRLKKNYKDTNPAGLKTCLQTIRLYVDNAAKNPTDKKYHRIKKENNAFKTRVAVFFEAIELLKVVGFVDDGGEFYAIDGIPDGFHCGQAIKFIDLIMPSL
ncbi:unnamed protein product [Vitrella brassicaformis CCMP3155]|uniref:UBA domain-containing protein n=2 Tax=Vitrella brassicaformis TaxID=1169539 RepID=A0A0G4GIM0_VITBC|nr:unnamed protein product [Vitrella brassicaformis CCMP3155]|mmetsp:Transcript_40082/g.100305  ORF Transcript_40082/g.100305 Transcript_40082/m.100305 type:complete len:374 (+) Transcript_40082:185-1306(+)|eukprot:CEM29680.1 unnamed protein product [Vitrella brassicaformis CCMP3155]